MVAQWWPITNKEITGALRRLRQEPGMKKPPWILLQRSNQRTTKTGFAKLSAAPRKQALRKRHRAGLDTFVLFEDVVKAFDSVDRSDLLAVLRKLGFGSHYCRAVENLHLVF